MFKPHTNWQQLEQMKIHFSANWTTLAVFEREETGNSTYFQDFCEQTTLKMNYTEL